MTYTHVSISERVEHLFISMGKLRLYFGNHIDHFNHKSRLIESISPLLAFDMELINGELPLHGMQSRIRFAASEYAGGSGQWNNAAHICTNDTSTVIEQIIDPTANITDRVVVNRQQQQ